METEIKEMAQNLRAEILRIGRAVNSMQAHTYFSLPTQEAGKNGEMHANITLAYRHLEDARMRLGKMIQAYDGGTSVYPK